MHFSLNYARLKSGSHWHNTQITDKNKIQKGFFFITGICRKFQRFSSDLFSDKVQIFWEGLKNLAHLPLFCWHYLVVSNYKWKMGQILVAFSEYLNITKSTLMTFQSQNNVMWALIYLRLKHGWSLMHDFGQAKGVINIAQSRKKVLLS